MRKKVRNELKRLSDGFKHLNDCVNVLEFKEKNKDKTYEIDYSRDFASTKIRYLDTYKTMVCEKLLYRGLGGEYTQNGKYLEFRSFGDLKLVYEVKYGDLVEVNLDMYKSWLAFEAGKKKIINAIEKDEIVCKKIDPANKVDIYEVETPDGEKAYAVVEDSGEVKQTKKIGYLTCDDIESCANCPMQLINCTRNCRDTDIPLTEMLKKVLSNPDTGEIEDPELYNLFKTRLDKPVKDDE